jgi:hypothetical protein
MNIKPRQDLQEGCFQAHGQAQDACLWHAEDVIWRGWHSKWLFAVLGISSGVGMVNDLEAGKGTVY